MHNSSERFSLLLVADAKLMEAGEALRRADLVKDCAQIAVLRAKVAQALAAIQNDVYDAVPQPRRKRPATSLPRG